MEIILKRDIVPLKRQSGMQLLSLPAAYPIDDYVNKLLHLYEGTACAKHFCRVL